MVKLNMEKIKWYLCSSSSSVIPYRFWNWDILTEEQLAKKNYSPMSKQLWHKYVGSPSLIPHEVMKEIEKFEKEIGYAICRPMMHGNTLVYTENHSRGN